MWPLKSSFLDYNFIDFVIHSFLHSSTHSFILAWGGAAAHAVHYDTHSFIAAWGGAVPTSSSRSNSPARTVGVTAPPLAPRMLDEPTVVVAHQPHRPRPAPRLAVGIEPQRYFYSTTPCYSSGQDNVACWLNSLV